MKILSTFPCFLGILYLYRIFVQLWQSNAQKSVHEEVSHAGNTSNYQSYH